MEGINYDVSGFIKDYDEAFFLPMAVFRIWPDGTAA